MTDFLTDVQAIANAAKSAIAEINEELGIQKANRESFLKQKENLFLQPLPKEDIKLLIFDYIDKQAQLYLDHGGMSGLINALCFPRRNMENDFPKPLNKAANLYELDMGLALRSDGSLHSYIFETSVLPIFNGYAFSRGVKMDLCFFFGDVLKEKIDAHFDTFFPANWDNYQPGLPLSERRPLIANLDAQITALNTTIKELESHLRTLSSSAKI